LPSAIRSPDRRAAARVGGRDVPHGTAVRGRGMELGVLQCARL